MALPVILLWNIHGTQDTVGVIPGILQIGQKYQPDIRIGKTRALCGGCGIGSGNVPQEQAAAPVGELEGFGAVDKGYCKGIRCADGYKRGCGFIDGFSPVTFKIDGIGIRNAEVIEDHFVKAQRTKLFGDLYQIAKRSVGSGVEPVAPLRIHPQGKPVGIENTVVYIFQSVPVVPQSG